jgi:hypothetical protein
MKARRNPHVHFTSAKAKGLQEAQYKIGKRSLLSASSYCV